MGRFDANYYDRFYGDAGVHDHERIGHLATAVLFSSRRRHTR